ncbi:hypothetical protein BKH17_08480 [Actinomyces oris]|uniref:hypothetical protein n=1 Tax=Actinomyces oris TaxID=544580 RepID=UPI000949CBD3|nr:hypothetical protein [Actinomyces oris]OLL11906.1 hypothetical protein BKH17_08480 [Actinomyces oris]
MTEQVEREQVVQNLAKQIDQVKHFSLRGIEEICHDASIGLLGPQDAIADEFVDDSLYRLLSNNELLAAFANAGFTPPGTVEARKELLSVFIDAMQRLDVLPHATQRDVQQCIAATSKAKLEHIQYETQIAIARTVAPKDVEIARIDAETRLTDTRANAALAEADARKRINDASDLHSEQIARESQFAQRDQLNLLRAQAQSAEDYFNFNMEQANLQLEQQRELRLLRIRQEAENRRDFWEKRLPNWISRWHYGV